MEIYGDLTLAEGAEINNITVATGNSFPANPNEGEMFYLTSGNIGLYVYDTNNSSWNQITNTTGALPSTGTFTGDLNLTGTGARIIADFSNATPSNRVQFETTSSNTWTEISAIPNGTGNSSYLTAYNANNANNSSYATLAVTASDTRILSGKVGGSYLPFNLYTGGSARITVNTSGNVGVNVTPSVYGNPVDGSFDIGSSAALVSYSNVQTEILNNAYYNGGWQYKQNGYAGILKFNPSGGFDIYLAPSNSSGYGAAVTATKQLTIGNNGVITNPATYNNTTATSANINVDSAGNFTRATSSIKYKTDVQTISSETTDAIFKMRPVKYKSLCEKDEKNWTWYGLIAEEVAEIDPRLVHFFDSKSLEPEGVMYDRLTVLLIDVVQRQKKQIDDLEDRLIRLEKLFLKDINVSN